MKNRKLIEEALSQSDPRQRTPILVALFLGLFLGSIMVFTVVWSESKARMAGEGRPSLLQQLMPKPPQATKPQN